MLPNGLSYPGGNVSSNNHLEFDLGQEINNLLAFPINLFVPFLSSKAFDFGDGYPAYSYLQNRILDLTSLKGLTAASIFFTLTLSLHHRISCLR